ncbi:hypothetical protein [Dysgonomonas capnocytophagoides]|uniref:hypothetical protein n=1 Tax=Dysgonomonas capnocytophagoides TaxID=45254 RepID=UPI00106A9AC0|nr:hypothetical protein [Dysgonomonas capnocytophagoides]
MDMSTEIRVKQGDIKEIAKLTNSHRNSVSESLKGKRFSRRAEDIRKIAISQFGGIEVSTK